ncbi:ATP-binding protein [Sulfurimonas crateris]|uniref:ATP-binding protein n=1 Tax=Sulfurimonas crateris TaxID=2574727 RepID=A0A4U2Z6Q3_9BACT|nr:ATP-binding protein [Sulfurimonas crateris]TKI69545.1 ATP-binding protein [Sulfurimonas crateris]
MFEISKNEVKERLYFDNPWWEKGYKENKQVSKYPKRSYFESFYDLIIDKDVNRAVILMGPRRVGKTVLVYHAIQELLNKNINGNNILYLSIETPIYTGLSLEKALRLFVEEFSHKRDDEEIYVFYDEIQYLKDWEIHLKSLVDSYPTYKFVATGSAAAALKLKSQESGAGRFTDFILPPLTFSEFIRFINKKELIKKPTDENNFYSTDNIKELNKEFINYLNYGGYPEAVFSEKIQSDSSRYIKSDIIDKVLLRDLPSLYGISDIQELNRLFAVLAYNTGREISYDTLAKSSGISKNTLRKYLEYLEAAFLIKRVYRIDQNAQRLKRVTTFKIYLTNPSMRAALFGNIDTNSDFMGELTETAIYSQWLHSENIDRLFYARWKKGEIDLVYCGGEQFTTQWFVEIKWTDRAFSDNSLLNNCVEFFNNNSEYLTDEEITVTTLSVENKKNYQNITFQFVPSSLYTYTVSTNLLKLKSNPIKPRSEEKP